MPRALLLTVRYHDGRYHGVGDWPPSPARLFQALIAGAARGSDLAEADREALAWLERLDPPLIAAPTSRLGRGFKTYVPNNDLDAVSDDLRSISEIRVEKFVRPRLFDARVPFLYRWHFEGSDAQAQAICRIAERLYQLGRGVDMAWARAEILEVQEAEARFTNYPGQVYRPSNGSGGITLPCPVAGSLESLVKRHLDQRKRLSVDQSGKVGRQVFTQPRRPRFSLQSYDCPRKYLLYELRGLGAQASRSGPGFAPWPFTGPVTLAERVRDLAAARLTKALSDKTALIERVFIGRGAGEADKDIRIRIIPLPSIGHPHAERSIRRLLVEVPPDCPLRFEDIDWAFSGLEIRDAATGPSSGRILIRTENHGMLRQYGISRATEDGAFRRWRTVTPAALPHHPLQKGRKKTGSERQAAEAASARAAMDALRHARIDTRVSSVSVQREPFEAKGARAESFAHGTRFPRERLRHVEVVFAEPVTGPVVIGDGRYLGLGLMAPVRDREAPSVVRFSIAAAKLPPAAAAQGVLRAVRRALMALDRDLDPQGRVSTLFSGHEADGKPAGDGHHRHVFLAAGLDAEGKCIARLYVIRPDAADRSADPDPQDVARFQRVVSRFRTVRAGALGILELLPVEASEANDGLLAAGRRWISQTDYRPTRHPKKGQDPAQFVAADCAAECRRRNLPAPREVRVIELREGPRGGIRARLEIDFAVAVRGPILLGRGSHMGEGVFVPRN